MPAVTYRGIENTTITTFTPAAFSLRFVNSLAGLLNIIYLCCSNIIEGRVFGRHVKAC